MCSASQHKLPTQHGVSQATSLRQRLVGIALVSDFFLLVTGVAGSCFYCKQRGAFAAADERAKGTVHFSDNDKKFGKKGRGRKDKGRAREIQLTNMRNAL